MRFIHENIAYPSPELKLFRDNGVDFDIVGGCWGSSFDMDMYDPKLLEKENDLSHYKKFYGCLLRCNEYETMKFRCKDLQYAQLIKYNSEDDDADIKYCPSEDFGIIQTRKKKVFNQAHLATFMLSYARINVIDQLFRFKDFDDIFGINVDGIYYREGAEFELSPIFKKKESEFKIETHSNYVDEKYEWDEYFE